MEAKKKKESAIQVASHLRCHGVANVARLIGCHPVQLSYIMHGKRKPSEKLRRRLARMGITTTVDGETL